MNVSNTVNHLMADSHESDIRHITTGSDTLWGHKRQDKESRVLSGGIEQ